MWARTTLWNALPAEVRLADLQDGPSPVRGTYTTPARPRPIGLHAPMTLAARGHLREAAYVRAAPAFPAAHLALAPNGASVTIDSWATDANGAAWYHATAAGATGWVYGDAVTFATQAGVAATTPLSGTGLWLTYDLLQTSPVAAIVSAARAAGVSHLYVEVGRSNTGLYGGPGLAVLLPVAHRAGIRVIAWVYPYLENLPADVAMSVAAARYVAPSGDRPDGLMADVEENMSEGAVRAYGQIVRATLGPRALMAVATFPPQWAAGRTYPFATVALSWDVIVPMDYWHVRRRAYSAHRGLRVRRATASGWSARRRGPTSRSRCWARCSTLFRAASTAPTPPRSQRARGQPTTATRLGVSFFEWNHATPEEWGALALLRARS